MWSNHWTRWIDDKFVVDDASYCQITMIFNFGIDIGYGQESNYASSQYHGFDFERNIIGAIGL